MNIVPLSEADIFIRDTLSEVRRGIARPRNANQANPLNGAMVDLPEKIDFEMMIVSSYQDSSLQRSAVAASTLGRRDASTGSSLESDSQSTIGLDRESGGQVSSTTGTGVDKDSGLKTKVSSESESSAGTNSKLDRDGATTSSTDRSSSVETEVSTDGGVSRTSDTSTSVSNDSSSETATSRENSTTNENESGTSTDRQNLRQSGQILESNKRVGRAFDKMTGRWGNQAFAPVTPQACTLKCS